MSGTPAGIRGRLTAIPVYYGWLVVAVCFGTLTVTFGTIYSFGVFFSHILAEFGLTHADTAGIFSLQSIVTFGSGTVLGVVIDRYGARRLAAIAAALGGVGLIGASQLSSALGLTVAYGIVAAAGFSIAIVIGYVTPSQWFERRRGLAIGLSTAGGGAGLLLMPPVASWLIASVGWQRAYLVLTGLFLGMLLLTVIVIADRPTTFAAVPANEFANGPPEGAGPTQSWRGRLSAILPVVTSGPFVLIVVGFLLAFLPNYMVLVHLVEHATAEGLGRGVGVAALSAIGVTNVVGKTVGGAASDRVGTLPSVTACIVAMAGGTIGLALGRTTPTILTMAVVFGLGYGGSLALLTPLLADFFGTLDLNILFGITMLAFAVAGSLGPYLAGVGFDTFGSFVPVMVGGGVVGLVGCGAILLAPRFSSR